MTGKTWNKRTWTGWWLMTILAVGVAGYGALAMMLSLSGQLPSMTHHFPDKTVAAAVHFGVGGFVLLIGPFQFLRGLRAKRPSLHRWTGRFYVAGCLASAVAAIVLATDTITGFTAQVGFTLLALAWITTTTTALVKAMQRKFVVHRRWMIRSYALTLAAVTLRIYLPSSQIAGIPFETAYPIISFACWVPNVIVAEWMLRRS
jgi:uncharacterized membrane protein